VGKTSIIKSLASKFCEEYLPTQGCDLTVHQTSMQGKPVKLICMDSLTENDLHLECRLKTIKNCDIAMFVFDLGDKESLAILQPYFRLLKSHGYRNKHLILAGNKADINTKAITDQEVQHFIESQSDLKILYHEVSAKTRQEITEMFSDVLEFGITPQHLRWLKLRYILFLRDKMSKDEELYNENWLNICEIVPNLIKRKTGGKRFPLHKLPPSTIIQLADYL
jgi:GTPase SAR1 family protein